MHGLVVSACYFPDKLLMSLLVSQLVVMSGILLICAGYQNAQTLLRH